MCFLTIVARRSVSVAERCAVTSSEKLPCGGSSSITQADCEAASNCYYDLSSSTSPCYYANDGQWLGRVSRGEPSSLDLGSLQLVNSSSPSCRPVTSLSSFVMYQFPVGACGSTVQVAGGNVNYQNTMSAAITVRTGPEGSNTRDSVYKLFFQCTYSGSQDVQVEAEVYTVAPPLPVVEQGPFDLELVIATGTVGGGVPECPYTGDNYLTSLVTVDSTSGVAYPSHYKRFVFEMFAFVDPVARQALAEKVGFVAKGNPALWFL
ncbi:ZP4 protein, partial [Polypterus senegalus]